MEIFDNSAKKQAAAYAKAVVNLKKVQIRTEKV